MPDPNPKIDLSTEQRTELVAYLDGELDPASAERIRKLLAENADARREAEELTIAWDALDSLDGVKAPQNFTERTVTSIQALADTGTHSTTRPFDLRRGSMLGGWMIGIVASAVAGYCATNWSVSQESQDMVRDYELINSLQKYERVGSVEVLKVLEEQELFDNVE
jgi:anti-sigma factor RsiW